MVAKKTRNKIIASLVLLIVLLFLVATITLFRGSKQTCNTLMMLLPAAKEEGYFSPKCIAFEIDKNGRASYMLRYESVNGYFSYLLDKTFTPLTFEFSRIIWE